MERQISSFGGLAVSCALLFAGASLPCQGKEHRGDGGDCSSSVSGEAGRQRPKSPEVHAAQTHTSQNALFDRTEGWTGADGAHSVRLGPDRLLWLFSDTWVGSIREGKRTDATIVNNSLALQEGRGDAATIRFVVRAKDDGQPQAWITPSDGRGWFWLQAGALLDEKLVLFLSQIEKTDGSGVFSFRPIGQWLGTVDNPRDDPLSWRIDQRKLPHTLFTDKRELTFGAALLKHGRYLYVYGTDEAVEPKVRDRHLILARVPTDKVGDFDSWEFRHDGTWQRDFRKSTHLVADMASDGSVTYLPDHRRFVLVYTERGLSERILARVAMQPWGPWSEPSVVYRCPEAKWDRRVFCYNAKAHGPLSSSDELTVSYVANSFDFWHVAADARLYWPRFVRVRLDFEQ